MKPVKFSEEVRSLTERRYRHHGYSIACHAAFEFNLYHQAVVVFSHSLDPKETLFWLEEPFLGEDITE